MYYSIRCMYDFDLVLMQNQQDISALRIEVRDSRELEIQSDAENG